MRRIVLVPDRAGNKLPVQTAEWCLWRLDARSSGSSLDRLGSHDSPLPDGRGSEVRRPPVNVVSIHLALPSAGLCILVRSTT